MKRILVVKLWASGDILMATPILAAIQSQHPECEVTWLADSSHADILQGQPLIENVICFDSGRWRWLLRKGHLLKWLREACHLNRQLRQCHFDAVINCHPEKWWSRIFSVSAVRVGLFPSSRLPLIRLLYTTSLAKPADVHNTDYYLRGVEALGVTGPFDRHMRLHISSEDREVARDFLRGELNYRPELPTIILHPGTSQPTKCWPVDSFAALATLLTGMNVVITGSSREQILAEAIAAAMPKDAFSPIVAAGHLNSIKAAAALVEMAAGVVTGDTSILHIASALGTPFVGIFGSSRPKDNEPLFGPQALLFDDDVSCAPCYREHCPLSGNDILKCQKAITPHQVFAALTTLLKETYERSSSA